MKNIKAICFDLDGVFFISKGKNSFHAYLIEMSGDKEKVDELMHKSLEMSQLVRGLISPTYFWEKVREKLNLNTSDKNMDDESLAARWVQDYEVDKKVLEAVMAAKIAGYKTCVCTNNNAIRLPLLVAEYKLNDLFDVIVSSHEVGVTKPDSKIFQALLKKLEIEADELIYSDDNENRLDGANKLGIHTFKFESFEQFLQELKKLGVDLGSLEIQTEG